VVVVADAGTSAVGTDAVVAVVGGIVIAVYGVVIDAVVTVVVTVAGGLCWLWLCYRGGVWTDLSSGHWLFLFLGGY
jgi:hypothetical protein